MRLIDVIQNHEFSPEAEAMFAAMASNGPTDEGMLVVICAAAYLLCTNFPEKDALDEAEAVIAYVRADLCARALHPRLRIVGGRDV
ncbi:hypothetical protein [Pseudorhodobacter sp.]|uniref:hypothetical protein n=1 Tax=Pseudorhodobacter sp. TaxID=1934400 RepID=UPI00264795D5|nr:hypothetical protein [Pseudorhodobacter sp.]MDN5785721.1 hypothetical protein [Pseudorhodobacter sp.]